jgi:S-adenosylmethionine/arginine decarboxylase-like enzyme
MQPLVHKHLIVRAEVNSPPKDETRAKEFLRELIEGINMKILFGPEAKYVDIPGNRGLTCFAIIETSHVVMHTWDEMDPGVIQLDVYTCGALNTDVVFDFLKQFDPVKIDYKFLDRENDLHEIPVKEDITIPMAVLLDPTVEKEQMLTVN